MQRLGDERLIHQEVKLKCKTCRSEEGREWDGKERKRNRARREGNMEKVREQERDGGEGR